MRSFFDKLACVAVGRARSAKAREGASENTKFRWSALPWASLVGHCFAVLNMPLITHAAVEGVQVRQPAKSGSSAKQLNRPSAPVATRRLGRGLVGVFVVHDTISNQNPSCHSDVVRVHYHHVAESLTFGKTSVGQQLEGRCG